MTLTQRISDLEEKYLRGEEKAIGLLNGKVISRRFLGYVLASLSIETETEKVRAYLEEGYPKDGQRVYECAHNALRRLSPLTLVYSEPELQEHHDSPIVINDDYKSLINILINRFNETLGDVFPIKLENLK